MEDVREVGAELHRLAEAEPLDPFDTEALLARGRRGRRRRKVLTLGGTVAGVAAIAVAATLLPNLGTAGSRPEVSGGNQTPPQSSLFEPVPGVPYGEAGAGQTVTKEEATRRCALRYPENKKPLQGGDTFRSGRMARYQLNNGDRFASCIIPGGDKPTAALVAAAAKDPLPTTTAGQLRNCSVQLWVDLTGWRVMASDQSKRLSTTVLVAVSPSGRKAVACELGAAQPGMASLDEGNSLFMTLAAPTADDPVLTPPKGSQHADLYAASGGGGGYCPGTSCTDKYNYTGWGRVTSTATKVVLQLGPGPGHEVAVTDGWFAFTWLSTVNQDQVGRPKLTAYDKNGKVVKVIAK